MLGMTAMAAAIVMAFVGATSAMAAHLPVLCTKLPEAGKLCGEPNQGVLLKKGTILHGKAEKYNGNQHAILLSEGALGNELCEQSAVTGEITKTSPVEGKITSVTFTGNCKPCTTVTMKNLPYNVKVIHDEEPGKDLWLFIVTGSILAQFTGCPLGATCNFSTSEVHLDAENSSSPVLSPLILTLENVLKREAGSSFGCPAEGKWDANYTTECLNPPGTRVDCHLALDKLEEA